MSKYAYFGNMLCPGHILYFERSINPAQVTELFTNLAELLVARLRVTSYSATGLCALTLELSLVAKVSAVTPAPVTGLLTVAT